MAKHLGFCLFGVVHPGVLGALYGESQWSSGFGMVGNEEIRGEIALQPQKCL
jgi:hypothetical protein